MMSFCPLIKEPCKKEGCDWYYNGDRTCSIQSLASNTAIIMDAINEIATKK
jgi:hypothetical protein